MEGKNETGSRSTKGGRRRGNKGEADEEKKENGTKKMRRNGEKENEKTEKE